MPSGPIAQSQQTTIAAASVAETTIVTADAGFPLELHELIITTPNAAAATLTLRDATGGNVRAIIDYPNAAAAPGTPCVVPFNPPLQNAANANWTLQASANASGIHVTAVFSRG